jgi:MOB kinase activator 1
MTAGTFATRYVSLLLQWVSDQLDDEALFPTVPGVPFPAAFRPSVVNIFRRLFRVYAHLYHHHHEKIVELTFDAHLNSCFKHLMYFVLEFDLISPTELEPLQPLIDKLVKEDDAKWGPQQAAPGGAAAGPSAETSVHSWSVDASVDAALAAT